MRVSLVKTDEPKNRITHGRAATNLFQTPILQLPQRYINVIHNPASIQDENIVQLLKRSSARMLTIAPHVLAATERELSNVDPKVPIIIVVCSQTE